MKHGETVGRQGSYPLIILIIWLETPYPSWQIVHSFRFDGNSSLPSASKGRSWRDQRCRFPSSASSPSTMGGGILLGVFSTKMVQPPVKICQDTTKVPARAVHILIQNLFFFFPRSGDENGNFFGSSTSWEVCVLFWKTYTKFNSPWFFCVFFVKLIDKNEVPKKLGGKNKCSQFSQFKWMIC